MSQSRAFDFDREFRRIALTRALRDLPPPLLTDRIARARAYAAAAILSWSESDDHDAVRRTLLYRAHVAPRPALQPVGAAA